mmetsp:Transcript_49688/g.97181  ORF Transcript_49688/g.97181 Transcript_49688/m.97181 type:complete len:219 (+) Transcript_49688:3857-4513(+)
MSVCSFSFGSASLHDSCSTVAPWPALESILKSSCPKQVDIGVSVNFGVGVSTGVGVGVSVGVGIDIVSVTSLASSAHVASFVSTSSAGGSGSGSGAGDRECAERYEEWDGEEFRSVSFLDFSSPSSSSSFPSTIAARKFSVGAAVALAVFSCSSKPSVVAASVSSLSPLSSADRNAEKSRILEGDCSSSDLGDNTGRLLGTFVAARLNLSFVGTPIFR